MRQRDHRGGVTRWWAGLGYHHGPYPCGGHHRGAAPQCPPQCPASPRPRWWPMKAAEFRALIRDEKCPICGDTIAFANVGDPNKLVVFCDGRCTASEIAAALKLPLTEF